MLVPVGAALEASPSGQRKGLAEQWVCILEEGRPLLPGDLGTCLAKEKPWWRLGHPLLERRFLLWKGGFTLPPEDSKKCSEQLPC